MEGLCVENLARFGNRQFLFPKVQEKKLYCNITKSNPHVLQEFYI